MHQVDRGSSSNTSAYFEDELDDMNGIIYEVKSKIADYLKDIKYRVKVTESALKELEASQWNFRESVKQRARERDHKVASTVSQSLDILMNALDAYACETVRIRGDIEQKLIDIQDGTLKELNRFEAEWMNKFLEFAHGVANEIHDIRVELEKWRKKSSPNLSHERKTKHVKDVNSGRRSTEESKQTTSKRNDRELQERPERSRLKCQLTIPKVFKNSRKPSESKTNASALRNSKRTEGNTPAAGDGFVCKLLPIEKLRQQVASNVESKLNSLRIPSGSHRISDFEYRVKIQQLRKGFQNVRLNLSHIARSREKFEERVDVEGNGPEREPALNGAMTFLPNLQNNVFVRKSDKQSPYKRNRDTRRNREAVKTEENTCTTVEYFESHESPEPEYIATTKKIQSVPSNEHAQTLLTRQCSALFDGKFDQRSLQIPTRSRSRESKQEATAVETRFERNHFVSKDVEKTESILSYYRTGASKLKTEIIEEMKELESHLGQPLDGAECVTASQKTVADKGSSSETVERTDVIDKLNIFSAHESDGSMEDLMAELMSTTMPIAETRMKEKLAEKQMSDQQVRSRTFNRPSQELFQLASVGSKQSDSKIRSIPEHAFESVTSDMVDTHNENKDDTPLPIELKNPWDSDSSVS